VSGPVVAYWDGRRPLLPWRLDRWRPLGRRSRNFGDLLGPLVVAGLAGAPVRAVRTDQDLDQAVGVRLLSVGSILHLARDGDVVWGSGVNGKVPLHAPPARRLDVRAVRGPLTRRALAELGIEVPEVYGDPGLLVPAVVPGLVELAQTKTRAVTVLPHMSELPRGRRDGRVLSPRAPLGDVLRTIAQSERVVTSSLHGYVVAEALGVPVQLVRPLREPLFKYRDYVEGTSRELPRVYPDVGSALRDQVHVIDPVSAPRALTDAFPHDLFPDERVPTTSRGSHAP
jgi:pyruvyltransferase